MRIVRLVVLALPLGAALAQEPQAAWPAPDWPAPIAAALDRAGSNRAAIWHALVTAPAEQRTAMEYLVAGMPTGDLRALSAAALLEDCALAHAARAGAPWGARIPDDVFLDAVLPYAHVTETREPWRARLRELCLPLIEGCTTPGEAAQRLNQKLFQAVGVRYSTERRRADQSVSESIEQGIASCTGLSILLASACRAVGVPARLAGIAEWPNKRGNHTWVEVWDLDGWHFVGAAEPDPNGLDHTWFQADAALATPGDRRHGIWAVTWQPGAPRFPLVFAPGAEVRAIDVTARYLRRDLTPAADRTRLWIDVLAGQPARRVAARVEVRVVGDDGAAPGVVSTGTSRGEGADTNDHLEFLVPRGAVLALRVTYAGSVCELQHAGRGEAEELVGVHVEEQPFAAEADALRLAAEGYFAGSETDRAEQTFPVLADAMLRADEARARRIVWSAWRDAPVHGDALADFRRGRVRTADREARYTVQNVGEPGPAGFGLVIAMHGGGGVPTRVNDQQWQVMRSYYRPHPEVGGYRYVALRAPNDEWNGFYDDAIAPLVAELIRQFVTFGDVDPDRVCAIGYSHGGYGAFALGPKIPDRFAAVHASAAAPTPGESPALNLRNLRFSFMVGSRDTAYGRFERCTAFAGELDALRAHDAPGAFPTDFMPIEGNGHTGLPDRDRLAELCRARRVATPDRVRWEPTDNRIRDFYWLTNDSPRDGQRLDVRLQAGNRLEVLDATGVEHLQARLDARLVDFDRPLVVTVGGAERSVAIAPSARTLCETMLRRGDPQLASSCVVDLVGGPR
ncbi:MAG: hypothetical protein IPM29_30430 [Planctomycetes bacterium]|nr:hypothetical protein [Planctomycetota bacterium]